MSVHPALIGGDHPCRWWWRWKVVHLKARSELSSRKVEWSSESWKVVVCSWRLTCRSAGSVWLGRWNIWCIWGELRDHVLGRHGDEVGRAGQMSTCETEAVSALESKSVYIDESGIIKG